MPPRSSLILIREFGGPTVAPGQIETTGITAITPIDLALARELGGTLKPVVRARGPRRPPCRSGRVRRAGVRACRSSARAGEPGDERPVPAGRRGHRSVPDGTWRGAGRHGGDDPRRRAGGGERGAGVSACERSPRTRGGAGDSVVRPRDLGRVPCPAAPTSRSSSARTACGRNAPPEPTPAMGGNRARS